MNAVFAVIGTIGLVILTIVGAFVWLSMDRDETLVMSRREGHTLKLIDHTTMRSIPDRSHNAVLVFDGKIVSDQNVGFPLLPQQYPSWVIRNYGPDLSNPDRTPWAVYVSPNVFSRAAFEQLAACFEANRTDFDTAMDNLGSPGTIKRGRIGRLIYGEIPQPMVFQPKQGRYKPVYPDDTHVEERITVRPNGEFSLSIWSTNGKGSTIGGEIVTDTLQADTGQLHLTKPFVINDPMFKPRPEMTGLSDADYLQSFADSTGKPLLSVIKYSF